MVFCSLYSMWCNINETKEKKRKEKILISGETNMTQPVLIADKLNKTYTSAAGVEQHVLKDLSLTVPRGEFVAFRIR